MIWYLIAILFILINIRVNNILSKKIFYPPLFLSFLWLILILLHSYFRYFSTYTPNILSFKSLFYFGTIISAFTFGGLIAKHLSSKKQINNYKFYFSSSFIQVITIINLIIVFLYFNKVKELTGSYTDLRMFRYYTSVMRVDIGLIKYCVVFSIFTSILAFVNYLNSTKPSNFKMGLILLSTFTTAFLTGSRGNIFFLILSLLGVYAIYRRVNIKLLSKVVLAMFAAFIILATILKKSIPDAYNNKKEYSPVEKLEYFLYSYTTLPISAFDKFLNEPYDITYGDIAFRFPKAVLYKVGIIKKKPKKLVEKYVNVPDEVNVHTAFYKIIKDFGIIYSVLFMTIIGYIHSFFFINAKNDFKYLIGFSTLLFPLTMTFFEDNYMSILSTWIQIIIYTHIAKRFVLLQHDKQDFRDNYS